MKFTTKNVIAPTGFLANAHYVCKSYDCTNLEALATNGVIPAGTVVPANDATAEGILLNDVVLAESPNGAVIIHGFVFGDKLPTEVASAAATALKQVVIL